MLKTDYKNDVFSGQKKYSMTENEDNTVTFTDVTNYSQVGDNLGVSELNIINEILNGLANFLELTQTLSTSASTDFAFVNSAIHTDSSIQVFASRASGDVSGEKNTFKYSEICVTNGRCVVTYPKVETALSLKVRLFIKQKE